MDPLHIQKKLQSHLNTINAFSSWWKSNEQLVSDDWKDHYLKWDGRRGKPSLVFQAYLSPTNTEDSIDVFWMFLTSIWQQSAIHKAEVLAKAWWPATLLDPSKVKVLLKAWRKESASTTLMHKSLSSDEW